MERKMTRHWRTLASLVFALALIVGTMGVAVAQQGGQPKDGDHPACQNSNNPPDWCDDQDDGDDGGDGDDGDDGGDGEEPGFPEDCSGVVDAFREGGAPEEMTDGMQQLCDAFEGDGNGDDGDDGEGSPIGEGCDALVDGLSENIDEGFEEARALCEQAPGLA
jgi:hypothetical protein